MTKRKIEYWVILRKRMANFVAHMEEVLKPTKRPMIRAAVLCMDEQPVQLLKETRQPIAASEDHPHGALIMNTSVPVRRAFSCLQNCYPVFAKRRLARSERKWIGLWRWRPCSTHDTPTAIGLH